MWVRKSSWDRLVRKVDILENVVANLEHDTQIWVTPTESMPNSGGWQGYGVGWGKSISLGNFRGQEHILLSTIIQLLLNKLGFTLEIPSRINVANVVLKETEKDVKSKE